MPKPVINVKEAQKAIGICSTGICVGCPYRGRSDAEHGINCADRLFLDLAWCCYGLTSSMPGTIADWAREVDGDDESD